MILSLRNSQLLIKGMGMKFKFDINHLFWFTNFRFHVLLYERFPNIPDTSRDFSWIAGLFPKMLDSLSDEGIKPFSEVSYQIMFSDA